MSTPSAKLSVLVCQDFACVKIAGRANFMSSPDFKTLLTELNQRGYHRFIIDLSECVLMDSTFLGMLAGFGMMKNPGGVSGDCDIELLNPSARVRELLDNLGVLPLFNVTTSAPQLPADAKISTPDSIHPTQEQITRTCLESHETLMAFNPDNVARFKDVAQFLAEDLKKLQKPSQ
jgi:anti-sigma B factor antagonist